MHLSHFVLAFLSSALVAQANYSLDCNPLEKTCPPNAALSDSIKVDFTSPSNYFTPLYATDLIKYLSSGLSEQFKNHGDAPALKSNFYIMYGKVEVSCKTAQGVGLILNIFLQLDDGDEIDFEWVSTFKKQVQTNYFGKGVTGDYDRGQTKDLSFDTTSDYHTYTIEWTEDTVTWAVDGSVVRTLSKSSVAKDGKHDFPNSPSRVFIGLWSAGDSPDKGTSEWAGGKTSLDGAPFSYDVKYIKVQDYSTGKEYSYADKTGNNIKSNGGSINGRAGSASLDKNSDGKSTSSVSSTTSTSLTSSSTSQSSSSSIPTSSFTISTAPTQGYATSNSSIALSSSSSAAAVAGASVATGASVAAGDTTLAISASSVPITSSATSVASSAIASSGASDLAASDLAASAYTSSVSSLNLLSDLAASGKLGVGPVVDDIETEEAVQTAEPVATFTASATTVVDGHTTGVSYGVTTNNGQVETYTTSYVPLTLTQFNTHFVTVKRKHHTANSTNSTTNAGVLFEGGAISNTVRGVAAGMAAFAVAALAL